METAQSETRRTWRVFYVLLVLLAGFIYTVLEWHAPLWTSQWVAGLIGSTIALALIPVLVGAFTRFRHPQACIVALACCAALGVIGALKTGKQPEQGKEPPMLGYATAVPVATAAPRSMALAGDWNTTANRFESDHPDLKLGSNYQIMQVKVNALATPTISALDLLAESYAAAKLDPQWTAAVPGAGQPSGAIVWDDQPKATVQ